MGDQQLSSNHGSLESPGRAAGSPQEDNLSPKISLSDKLRVHSSKSHDLDNVVVHFPAPQEDVLPKPVSTQELVESRDMDVAMVEKEKVLDEEIEARATQMSRLSISKRPPRTPGVRLCRKRRLADLAKPKTNWQVIKNRMVYNCTGFSWFSPKMRILHFCVFWPSVYWSEQFLKDSTLSITVPVVSHRMEELSRPKRFFSDYYNNSRKSPIWPVSQPALEYHASRRLRELATPRIRKNIWSINMCQVSQVSKAARKAIPSPRILRLAKPRPPVTMLEEWNPIPKPKPYVSDYNRLLQLATPKALPETCVPDRDPRWVVRSVTKKAVATPRVVSLAQPKMRKDLNTDRDPYQVSPASLVAKATPRVQELATPKSITRKV